MLYVDDILLATNDTNLLAETKQILCNHFDRRDLVRLLLFWASRLFEIRLIMCCSNLREPIL